MIKDYIIKTRLGVGSYGTVYKVCKKTTGKIYVIKQISLLGLTEKEILEYKSEAKLLSSIKSNYVVKYFDSFIDNHNLNILMEYCDGGDLYQYLEKNKKKKIKLKEKTIWQIFIQMLIGLNSIHKKKILHRDIKSQNIFLTKNLDIKIGDLGVSKKLIQTNFAKTFIGTPYYLSPEICMEKPYNDKSDVWAIGCILYELCTFNYPFNAKSQGALLLKILNSQPEKIDNNYYSKDLQNMINLLLNKNYELRPSCRDILKMKIILEKAKKYNLINDIMNECDNININLLNKKISFKENKKENNIFEKQINIKSKNCKNNFYFNCNEEKPQKNNNNKIIKEALTKIMKKQTGKNDNIISLINNALKGIDSTKKEKNIIIDNNNKIKYNKSKEKINKDFNTEERINKKDKKIDIINIDKIISVDDNILKENTNKIKSKNIKEFADNLNSYVSRYKTSEIKEKKVASKIIKENNTFITPLSKKEKNVEINLDKNKYINNNINININNDLNDKNSNILNSIMNFKIINNNDSDIHININNNSNILNNNNNNNKSTISIDNNNTTDNKELYSEEENSEDQKEFVKEIKENKIYDINNDIKNIEEKISIIKEEMLKLIGGMDYNYIMNLYDSTNNNDNVDKIYEKIENFVDKYYDEDKKDNFNNLYYQLISLNHNLNKKENILI